MRNLTLLIKPVSGQCQFDCAYCFYRDEMKQRGSAPGAQMSEKTLENIIKKAFAAADDGVTFAFQGGEPTLAGIAFYEKVLALQRRFSRYKTYANTLQTNGGLIDDKWAAFLKKESFLVGLSLDGDAESHDLYRKAIHGSGTWQQVNAAGDALKRFEVPFNVLCVVSKANVAKPRETYEALKPYRFIQFIPCLEALGCSRSRYAPTAEEYAAFLDETFQLYRNDYLKGQYTSVRQYDNYIQMLMGMRPESCAMNGRCSVSFTIESDGSVYPCDFYCLDQWRLGSINEASFIEMQNTPKAKEFVNSSVSVHATCRSCKYYALCRGGCRRERGDGTEYSPAGLNRYCEAYKAFFDRNYEALCELKNRTSESLRQRKNTEVF